MFLPPSGQEAALLRHGSGESRHPSLLYLVRYAVEEVEIAVGKAILPPRLSLGGSCRGYGWRTPFCTTPERVT
jgi:hypothetical protein